MSAACTFSHCFFFSTKNICASVTVIKNAIILLILVGFCNTISVSFWPKPPALGSLVRFWPATSLLPSLTINFKPFGISSFISSPSVFSIVKEKPPFAFSSIVFNIPLTFVVKALLFDFSPVG